MKQMKDMKDKISISLESVKAALHVTFLVLDFITSALYIGCLLMRETITISVPEDIKEELDQIVKKEGVSRSDIVRESLRDYLFLRHFRQLRSRMVAKAQAQGIYTDEDVFKKIS